MTRQAMRSGFAVAMVVASATAVAAQELEVSGYVAGELRTFFESPRFPGQLDHAQPSLAMEPELRWGTANGRHELSITPFVRLDASDEDRSHADLREAFWRGVFGDWEVLVGSNVVFWGVTESRHLVNIVNQTDVREDVDEEDKLGQPMISIEWQRPWGRVSGMALLGFRDQPFPGSEGRLRLPLPVNRNAAVFPDGKRAVDFALRYAHFIGDFDVGVHAFHGTGREPAFLANDAGTQLKPLYRTITQVGLDLQYTRDAWLWKLEAIGRGGEGRTFGATVGGVEYTRYQVFDSAADLGLLGEYLYDGRDDTAPQTVFDNHGFLGARWALNDTQDTAVLAGAVVDLGDGTTATRIEFERRLTDRLKLEIESRLFGSVDQENILQSLSNDSFLTTRLSVFF